MIKVFLKDLSNFVVTNEHGDNCIIEGYAEHCKQYDAVYIEQSLNLEKQRLCVIHEILELCLPRMSHKRIDQVAIQLIEGLLQLKE